MTWCRKTTYHYLGQCGPRSVSPMFCHWGPNVLIHINHQMKFTVNLSLSARLQSLHCVSNGLLQSCHEPSIFSIITRFGHCFISNLVCQDPIRLQYLLHSLYEKVAIPIIMKYRFEDKCHLFARSSATLTPLGRYSYISFLTATIYVPWHSIAVRSCYQSVLRYLMLKQIQNIAEDTVSLAPPVSHIIPQLHWLNMCCWLHTQATRGNFP